ncbi:anti-sigma-factor antagonist [Crinalium epipsammum PCC 9333]|uniref:Anti-sigma factor antagonist n=1 Tax=Crinalium epipsammum PCC 9333 TaxID=1173022 RepID=K9W006_9CYAN|nr:STAS domain-containing protein [Crinalium epipsammum]AFZ12755.1 anti-sigma-factor antagonist [Crinalium epipsammum PCC 9333]
MSSEVKVVEPTGILDGIRGNKLRQEISDHVEKGAKIVLIDLKNVTFMDSSGLSALVSALKTVRTGGGKLYLSSINDQVKMVFDLTRMDRVFETFASVDDFNQAMSKES